MASTHTKLSARVDDPGYTVRGRTTGGKLHRRGKKKWKPEEVSPMASKAVVVHKVKTETALEAKIVAALERAEALIAAHCILVAEQQFARLEAIQYKKFVSATDRFRENLIITGVIS